MIQSSPYVATNTVYYRPTRDCADVFSSGACPFGTVETVTTSMSASGTWLFDGYYNTDDATGAGTRNLYKWNGKSYTFDTFSTYGTGYSAIAAFSPGETRLYETGRIYHLEGGTFNLDSPAYTIPYGIPRYTSVFAGENMLVTSNPYYTGTYTTQGRVYVYQYSTSWSQSITIDAPVPTLAGNFGIATSVNIDGTVLAVVGLAGGVVNIYIYNISGDTATLAATLNSTATTISSVSVQLNSDGTALVAKINNRLCRASIDGTWSIWSITNNVDMVGGVSVSTMGNPQISNDLSEIVAQTSGMTTTYRLVWVDSNWELHILPQTISYYIVGRTSNLSKFVSRYEVPGDRKFYRLYIDQRVLL